MNILFTYQLFLPDNHQGGSGVWFKKKEALSFSGDTTLDQMQNTIYDLIEARSRNANMTWKDGKAILVSIELC